MKIDNNNNMNSSSSVVLSQNFVRNDNNRGKGNENNGENEKKQEEEKLGQYKKRNHHVIRSGEGQADNNNNNTEDNKKDDTDDYVKKNQQDSSLEEEESSYFQVKKNLKDCRTNLHDIIDSLCKIPSKELRRTTTTMGDNNNNNNTDNEMEKKMEKEKTKYYTESEKEMMKNKVLFMETKEREKQERITREKEENRMELDVQTKVIIKVLKVVDVIEEEEEEENNYRGEKEVLEHLNNNPNNNENQNQHNIIRKGKRKERNDGIDIDIDKYDMRLLIVQKVLLPLLLSLEKNLIMMDEEERKRKMRKEKEEKQQKEQEEKEKEAGGGGTTTKTKKKKGVVIPSTPPLLSLRDYSDIYCLLELIVAWGIYPFLSNSMVHSIEKREIPKSVSLDKRIVTWGCRYYTNYNNKMINNNNNDNNSAVMEDCANILQRIIQMDEFTGFFMNRYTPEIFAAYIQLEYNNNNNNNNNGKTITKAINEMKQTFPFEIVIGAFHTLLHQQPKFKRKEEKLKGIWFSKKCGKHLSSILIQNGGFESTLSVYLGPFIQQGNIDTRVTMELANLFSKVPEGITSEVYYQSIGLQINELITTKLAIQVDVYLKLISQTIGVMYSSYPDLTLKYVIIPMLSPLCSIYDLCNTQSTCKNDFSLFENCLDIGNYDDNNNKMNVMEKLKSIDIIDLDSHNNIPEEEKKIIIKEEVLQSCIQNFYALLAVLPPLPGLIKGIIDSNAISALFAIYVYAMKTKSGLFHEINTILLLLMENIDEKKVHLYLIDAIKNCTSFINSDNDNDNDNDKENTTIKNYCYKFQAAGLGGIEVVEYVKKNSIVLNNESRNNDNDDDDLEKLLLQHNMEKYKIMEISTWFSKCIIKLIENLPEDHPCTGNLFEFLLKNYFKSKAIDLENNNNNNNHNNNNNNNTANNDKTNKDSEGNDVFLLMLLAEIVETMGSAVFRNGMQILRTCSSVLKYEVFVLKSKEDDNDIEHEKQKQDVNDEDDQNTYPIISIILGLLTVLFELGNESRSEEEEIEIKNMIPMLEKISLNHTADDITEMAANLHAIIISRDLTLEQKKEMNTNADKILAFGTDNDNIDKGKSLSGDEWIEAVTKFKNDLKSPVPALRAYGVVTLTKMLNTFKKTCILGEAEKVYSIFIELMIEMLADSDSYVFLAAVKGLSSLCDTNPYFTVPKLVKYFIDTELDIQLIHRRIKLGEALLLAAKKMGEGMPKYAHLFVHAFVKGGRERVPDYIVDEEERLQFTDYRCSCLSNLAEICELLRWSLSPYLEDVFDLIMGIITMETGRDLSSCMMRRGAVYLMLKICKGCKSNLMEIIPGKVRKFYEQLLLTNVHDSDDVVKFLSSQALELIDNLIKEQFRLP